MNADDVLDMLGQEPDVSEAHVLCRELKLFLDVGDDLFPPSIRVKIYKAVLSGSEVYEFQVSHHVHTPVQAAPYYPSGTIQRTEKEAILRAISTTTSFIKSAIAAGHSRSDRWLIPNTDF